MTKRNERYGLEFVRFCSLLDHKFIYHSINLPSFFQNVASAALKYNTRTTYAQNFIFYFNIFVEQIVSIRCRSICCPFDGHLLTKNNSNIRAKRFFFTFKCIQQTIILIILHKLFYDQESYTFTNKCYDIIWMWG